MVVRTMMMLPSSTCASLSLPPCSASRTDESTWNGWSAMLPARCFRRSRIAFCSAHGTECGWARMAALARGRRHHVCSNYCVLRADKCGRTVREGLEGRTDDPPRFSSFAISASSSSSVARAAVQRLGFCSTACA